MFSTGVFLDALIRDESKIKAFRQKEKTVERRTKTVDISCVRRTFHLNTYHPEIINMQIFLLYQLNIQVE